MAVRVSPTYTCADLSVQMACVSVMQDPSREAQNVSTTQKMRRLSPRVLLGALEETKVSVLLVGRGVKNGQSCLSLLSPLGQSPDWQ